jgi:superfamily I DNA/RNA helicase
VIKVIHIEDLKSYTCDLEKFKMITKELKSNTNIPSIIIKNLWEYYFNSYIDYFADISYGYCITCHKSQGSTYKNVFVDLGNILNMNRKEKEGMKCLYTAITRAAENLIIYY